MRAVKYVAKLARPGTKRGVQYVYNRTYAGSGFARTSISTARRTLTFREVGFTPSGATRYTAIGRGMHGSVTRASQSRFERLGDRILGASPARRAEVARMRESLRPRGSAGFRTVPTPSRGTYGGLMRMYARAQRGRS